jgi:catechol 2,3-dioxygenase-like lactoylglutathione lyase family enzyme
MNQGEGRDSGDVVRIQHVAMEVPAEELERAASFWRLVGFEPVDPPASLWGRAIWLEAGPAGARTQIHLLSVAAEAEQAVAPPGKGNHAAIVVPAWQETLAALREADFEIEERKPHWGAERAFATLPGGHTVELTAAAPN